MKLVVKFNLVLITVFGLGLAAAAYVSNNLLQHNAREEVLQNARMVMASALASRAYTSKDVAPLLRKLPDDEFHPETVPAFGATEQFNTVHAQFPDFSYKEATLNPTNLRDKATDWEADLIGQFKQNPKLDELIAERDVAGGARTLSLAKPMRIEDPSCLTCHSTVDAAPKSLIAKYGPANGFGWELHSVIGAQIVTVPMALPIKRANEAFYTFISSIGGVFVLVFILLDLMLMFVVVRRATDLAKAADEVSLGKLDAPEFPAEGKDEIAGLAQSFNRMKKSLSHAIKMLEE